MPAGWLSLLKLHPANYSLPMPSWLPNGESGDAHAVRSSHRFGAFWRALFFSLFAGKQKHFQSVGQASFFFFFQTLETKRGEASQFDSL